MNKEIEAPKIKKEIDDFDLGSVGISHDFDDQLDEEQIFKTIKLGKPDADDWFKLFPPDPGKLGSFIVGVVSKIKDAKNHKSGTRQPGMLRYRHVIAGQRYNQVNLMSKTMFS